MSSIELIFLLLFNVCSKSISFFNSSSDQFNLTIIITDDVENFTSITTMRNSSDVFTSQERRDMWQTTTTTAENLLFSSIDHYYFNEVPLLFSILSLTIRSSNYERDSFYSVDINYNSTCSSKREFNVTLVFQSSFNDFTRRCFHSQKSPEPMRCSQLVYGVQYTIDGNLQCDRRNVSLTTKKQLYKIGEPKYFNSTPSPTSIDSLFYLPGLFHRLIIQLTSVNQTCSIAYSSVQSPFYRCLFKNLPSAQWFILNYYVLTDDQQSPSADVTIVHTAVEDFDFQCQWNKNGQQLDFFWKNLTAFGYQNLTISVSNEKNSSSWNIFCDPYFSRGICSIGLNRFEPGEKYFIRATLKKILPNYNGQKNESCSIQTNLSEISLNSVRHEFLDKNVLLLTWSKHRFDLQVRLKNFETNFFSDPIDTTNETALFIDLIEATVYQLEFHISKANWPSLKQTTNYFIQTELKKASIEKIVRLSETSFRVDLNGNSSGHVELLFCIEEISDFHLENRLKKFCSHSNQFNGLFPASLYNVSIVVRRNSFQKDFHWKNETTMKIVNTNPTSLRVRTWRKNDSMETRCAVELINRIGISHFLQCFSLEENDEESIDCFQLRCGCRYESRLIYNQSNIRSICSKFDCDLQLNHSEFNRIQFQTPLESIENLRLKSSSSILKRIEVTFDSPSGCFDQLFLVCEMTSAKIRRTFVNSNICEDLLYEEFYRIYVQTKRIGWETVTSNVLQTRLLSPSEILLESNKKQYRMMSIILPCVLGILFLLILFLLVAFLFVFRQKRRKQNQPRTSSQTIHQTNATITKSNHILHQLNIFPLSRQSSRKDSNRKSFVSRPIRIKDFPFAFQQLIDDNFFQLSNEFRKLQEDLPRRFSLAQCDQTLKNRYNDIKPYEHSRVKLIPIDESDSDYINANFVAGLHKPREYIVCQAPIKTTLNDHWKMIWEQNVSIIVMLTNLNERGKNKCERYFPLKIDQMETYGSISVCVTDCDNRPAYDLRYIQVERDGQIRSLKHYAFKMWDDHTVPTTSDILRNFIRLIRSEYRPQQHGPILVHCSAGVGRSGTFIALDRLLQQFDQLSFDDYIDVYGTVLELRTCREKMVQNEHQYLFIYRCLKEEYEKASGHTNYAVVADESV